ncbi:hypothetical protein AGMMS50262_18880 [Bacteroidia bacterium]|nr:hypothetical protein AGMMS50262_18880 [Bacteroidia bacterium]
MEIYTNMKVAHITHSGKFVDDTIGLFDSIDYLDNTYYFMASKINNELQCVKNKKYLVVKNTFKDIIDDILERKFSVVILYSKSYGMKTRQLLRLNKETKLIWISFGFDIYSDTSIMRLDKFPIKMNLFSTKTKRYLISHLRYLLGMFYRSPENYIAYPRFLQRVDYVSTVFNEEYEWLMKDKNLHAKRFSFKFVDHNKYDKLPEQIAMGKRWGILVGNSIMPTANHLDIFEKLKAMPLAQKDKIIVPLSYAGAKTYRNYLIRVGKKMLGEQHLMPLLNYVPLNEYLSLLANCKAAIMGYKRQQGIGNISWLFIYGAKVYLPKESVTYLHYKNMGVEVFSIEEDLTYEHLNTPLSHEQIEKNFNRIKQAAHYDIVRNDLKKSIDEVIKDLDENDIKFEI